jgi:hypothetical protein
MAPSVRRSAPSNEFNLIACLVALAIAGCNSHIETAEARLEKEYELHPGFKRPVAVAKFAGMVSIDGKRPQRGCRLFVILNDPEHLDAAVKSARPSHYAVCDRDGNFAFTTYERGDGVPPGKYVLTLVELHLPTSNSRGNLFNSARLQGGPRQYDQPDELKNLYNDPEKNLKQDTFKLDVQLPGKADYRFALAVAGKPPILKPGANALTGRPFLP